MNNSGYSLVFAMVAVMAVSLFGGILVGTVALISHTAQECGTNKTVTFDNFLLEKPLTIACEVVGA